MDSQVLQKRNPRCLFPKNIFYVNIALTDLKLSPSNIILGDFTTPNILVNLITLLSKRYIFLCKSNNQLPVLSRLLGCLKFNCHVDKGICLKLSRIDSLLIDGRN